MKTEDELLIEYMCDNGMGEYTAVEADLIRGTLGFKKYHLAYQIKTLCCDLLKSIGFMK